MAARLQLTLFWYRPHCLSCKCTYSASEQLVLHKKSGEVFIKTRSIPASLPSKGQVTEQTTVKWSIPHVVHIRKLNFFDVEIHTECCFRFTVCTRSKFQRRIPENFERVNVAAPQKCKSLHSEAREWRYNWDKLGQTNGMVKDLKLFQARKQLFLQQFFKRKFGLHFPPISLRTR